MTEARQVAAWDQTAMIVAKLHNSFCTKAEQMIRNPGSLNPYRPKAPKMRVPLKDIRAAMEARHGS